MYLFGGYDGRVRKNDLVCLDMGTFEWKVVETSGKRPTGRCNFSASVVNNCLYVFAGHSGAATTSDLYELNFDTSHWNQIEWTGEGPSKRLGHTSMGIQGSLYVFAGTSANHFSNELFQYDIERRRWNLMKSTGNKPKRRCYHAAVVVEHGPSVAGVPPGYSMYVFGGSTSSKTAEFKGDDHLYEFRFARKWPPCMLRRDLFSLLDNQTLADVIFLTDPDGIPFYCNRLIIQVRCPALLETIDMVGKDCKGIELKNKKKLPKRDRKTERSTRSPSFLSKEKAFYSNKVIVALPNIKADVFEEFICFIYTSQVSDAVSLTPGICIKKSEKDLPLEDLFDLLLVSVEFKLQELRVLVENKIISLISLNSVVDILKFNSKLKERRRFRKRDKKTESLDDSAFVSPSESIKECCINFILKNYTEVIKQAEFETVPAQLLVTIMRLSTEPGNAVVDTLGMNHYDPNNDCEQKFLDDMASLRNDESSFNFFFRVRGVIMGAHIEILASRSDFFQGVVKDEIRRAVKKNSRQEPMEVIIGSVIPTPKAFSDFLDFMYFGTTDIPPESAVYLLNAPGYYGLHNERLRLLCTSNMIQNINENNLLDVLQAADDVQANQLKEFILKTLVRKFTPVIKNNFDQVRSLKKALLLDIIVALADNEQTK